MADIKIKKKDKLKVFSILAAIILALAVGSKIIVGFVDLAVRLIMPLIYGGSLSLSGIVPYLIGGFDEVVICIAAMVAMFLLFTNKNGWAVFAPIGLLTFMGFNSVFYFILDWLLIRLLYAGGIAPILVSVMSQVLSILIAALIAVILCIAATTLLKNRRSVLMFITFAMLLIGCVASFISTALGVVSVWYNISYWLADFAGIITLYVIWIHVLVPFLGVIIEGAICLATLLAAVGMCSKPVEVSSDPKQEIKSKKEKKGKKTAAPKNEPAPAAPAIEPAPEATPAVEDKPAPEAKPATEATPAVEDKPAPEAKPVPEAKPTTEAAPVSEKNDTVAELRKYRTLYEKGILTQAQFEAKKKQLLGM